MRFFVLTTMFCVACGSPKDEGSDDEWDDGGSSTGGDAGNADGIGGDDDGDDGDDDGEEADTTPGRFLGQMNAETYTVWESGVVEGVEIDAGSNWGLCSGGVSFTLDDDLDFEGDAGCSSYVNPNYEPDDPSIDPNDQSPYTLNFDISGSQTDGTIEGSLVIQIQGDEMTTPFTGTRSGNDIEASYDTVHGEGGNRFEISGTLTATWVE